MKLAYIYPLLHTNYYYNALGKKLLNRNFVYANRRARARATIYILSLLRLARPYLY